MNWFELMDDGNTTYAVGPFEDSDAGATWAAENETEVVTARGGVPVMSRTAWKRHRTEQASA